MAEEDPVNIRRREFEILRKEVADMKIMLTEDENSEANRMLTLKRVAMAMGFVPEEIFV